MEWKKVLSGTIIWSIAILITIVAVKTLNGSHKSEEILLGITWFYLILMCMAGAVLVVTGFRDWRS
jgi:uncharacterized membrane protein